MMRPLIFRRAIAALMVAWLLAAGARTSAGDLAARLDALAAKTFDRQAPPGMAVAVMRDGDFVFAHGYGLADLENNVPCAPQSVFRLASVSKPIAAVAVLQVVESGAASLDDPIQKYVPEFPEKPAGTITLRHLLSHTSGIRHYKPGEFVQRRHYDSLAEAIGIFKDDPLKFAPGARFSYTSYGYNLLAGVIERTSGRSFGEYLAERVFEPAGMTSTRLELQGELVPHRVEQYERAARGKPWRNAPFADLSIKWAGGGVISTVEDLCRFDNALARGRLLKPETITLMQTPVSTDDGKQNDYALGWRIETDAQGRTWVAHSGGTTGGTSYFLRWPEQRIAVAVIANGAGIKGLPALAKALALAASEPTP